MIFGTMSGAAPEFYYDYVDPASYLVDRILAGLGGETPLEVVPRPFELRRPPGEMVDPRSDDWKSYRDQMRREAGRIGVEMEPPDLVPWSRKAHELALHAREKGVFPEIHRALFRAYFQEGRDVGRVDVLVGIAVDRGLDRTEVKAILDVDKYLETVESERSRAERRGVRGVPTLLAGERKLEGFRPEDEIRTFLSRETDEP